MKKKVICGGCFNKIHPGHIHFLKKAKSLGDFLVVVLANDKNNKKKYGKNALQSKIRKKNIEKLKIADEVVIGDYPVNYKKMIKRFKPDVIALGYDQEIPINKRKIKVVRISKFSYHT